MQKILILLLASLFVTLSIKGQSLFFIGENSYPSTETITLRSNSEDGDDLDILLARDGKKILFAVDTQSYTGVIFEGNLIIYLDDGTVITCIDRGKSDHVDDRVKAVYNLTSDELNKMKNSNIHTVRYTLKCSPCKGLFSSEEGNWSASNKGIQTKIIITKFFDYNDVTEKATEKVLTQEDEESIRIKQQEAAKREAEEAARKAQAKAEQLAREQKAAEEKAQQEKEAKKKKLDELMGDLNGSDGDPYGTSYYGSPGSGSGTGGYGLNGRSLVSKGKIQQECNEEGRVVVKITVDRNGKVINATPGVKGTTNSHPCLLEPAKKTAFLHKWNLDSKAPNQQIGFVVVNFKLGE